jgi:hypothetical protein
MKNGVEGSGRERVSMLTRTVLLAVLPVMTAPAHAVTFADGLVPEIGAGVEITSCVFYTAAK